MNREGVMAGKQYMKDIKAGGDVKQKSDIPAEQFMEQIEAVGNVVQLLEVVTRNLDTVRSELKELLSKLEAYDPNAAAELDRLRNAVVAAEAGQSQQMLAALKGTARWVADFATKVGTSVVAKILEKQIGL
jgi:hypothetical protein